MSYIWIRYASFSYCASDPAVANLPTSIRSAIVDPFQPPIDLPMSSLLGFGMASSKKEKHYANSRARRHSGTVVISQSSKKSKKDKDTDTESVTSTTPSSTDTVVVPPPKPKKCPLRFMLAGMMESKGEEKESGCPLRRVQLWHTIPLCLLAITNLLLVIIALLSLAGYRISMRIQDFVVKVVKSDLDCNPYAESLADTEDSSTVVSEKH